MYLRGSIVQRAAITLKQMGSGSWTIGEFLQKFHWTNPYPSTSTLYHRFGSIRTLIEEAREYNESNAPKQ